MFQKKNLNQKREAQNNSRLKKTQTFVTNININKLQMKIGTKISFATNIFWYINKILSPPA